MPTKDLPLHATRAMREAHARAKLMSEPSEALTKQLERPNEMSFGEQVVEALGEFVEAKLSYEQSRLTSGSEWANSDNVTKTGNALQELLDKVRHG